MTLDDLFMPRPAAAPDKTRVVMPLGDWPERARAMAREERLLDERMRKAADRAVNRAKINARQCERRRARKAAREVA